MLDPKIKKKLESLNELPTIPFIIADVLHALENSDIRASSLANLIERDQTLTAKVLRVANSPFYGFQRRISTIELAIVLLGLNTIKEIVVSLILQKFFTRVRRSVLDTKQFWEYSVFCGAAARLLARKLGYRLAGEAFVAGLMHDIGILIMSEYFSKQYAELTVNQQRFRMSFQDAEKLAFNCTHCDIGAWFAERWFLPKQLCEAIRYHHHSYIDVRKIKNDEQQKNQKIQPLHNASSAIPLTAIVAMAEWFAIELGYKSWSNEKYHPVLYLANEILTELSEHDILNKESAIEVLKQEIMEEYEKASVLNEVVSQPLY